MLDKSWVIYTTRWYYYQVCMTKNHPQLLRECVIIYKLTQGGWFLVGMNMVGFLAAIADMEIDDLAA